MWISVWEWEGICRAADFRHAPVIMGVADLAGALGSLMTLGLLGVAPA